MTSLRNTFQASNPERANVTWVTQHLGNSQSLLPVYRRSAIKARQGAGTYPEIPAGWPNRATRRAVQKRREHRLSSEWRQVLVQRPVLRFAMLGL